MKRQVITGLLVLVVMIVAGSVSAVPRLQTYIVDSEYSNFYSLMDQRSWVTNSQQFDLKVIGYWGEADNSSAVSGTVNPVGMPSYDRLETYLAISVPWNQSGTVWINGVEINSFGRYRDALPVGVNPDWTVRYLPPAILGKFNFHAIGSIDNDQVNAWSYDHGLIHSPGWGDEILMDVVVNGFDWAHFDAVGVDANGRTFTSAWDDDSSYFATPEPGTLSLLGLGLLGLAPFLRRKKNS
ncbi:MAG: choice-of-anchor N protein [Bacteroidales bacterium]|nr:choice-of-anchor N protein [Candidatus Latescibacterota bacterium]